MKLTSFIPPLLALAIVGGWIGTRRQSIATLEQESRILHQRIAARSTGGASDSPDERPAPPEKSAKHEERIDWKKLAADFSEMRNNGGMRDMRATIRLQSRLQKFTKEQILQALDEISALNLADEDTQMLEAMLIGPLMKKDPELALTQFIDRIQDDGNSVVWQLSHGLQEWAAKDPVAAIAWFDTQIAAGKFDSKSLDGKSRPRIQFEGGVINTLLGTDPQAAGERLAAMPEDQRGEVLSQFQFTRMSDENQLAFAQLVREQVPAKSQGDALARQAAQIASNGDYDKVSDYFNRIQATPEERAKCAQEAAEVKMRRYNQKKPTREDFETMRDWLGQQAPDAKDRITGEILGNAMQGRKKMEFAEASELALQYHESSGNDDVLGAFLESWPARNHKQEARALAEKISDAKRREEILTRLK